MGIIKNIFGRKAKAPSWKDLTPQQRAAVTRKIVKAYGAQYNVVSGFNETQRRRAMTETQDEDSILGAGRGRLLDLTRNAARNSATFQTILKQFDFQVCGVKGGKVLLNFPDSDFAHDLRDRFADWTRNSDYFDGLTFNSLLKIILKEQLIGGDTVLLFDDGLLEDSGKLITYETDEIQNTTADALAKAYGNNARQSYGKVYSGTGRFIGAIVSRSQRGAEVFQPEKSFFLKRNPDESPFESYWYMPQNFWRISQGRGISQAAASIATITDLEDLCGYELQSAKHNSQVFAQIIRTGDKSTDEDADLPSAFGDTDFSGMSDEEIEAAAKAETQSAEKTISFNAARSAGICYEAMPDDYRFETISTPHPNEKVADFIKWLAGRSSAVFGLSEAYATMMPTGDSFRAQQLLTQPAFVEAQKQLEQICDWVFYRFVMRLVRKGEIDGSKLPKRFMQYVSWAWPQLDELDEAAHQSAAEMKLRNLTGSLRDELGADWEDKLLQIKNEIDFCKRNGLPHPSFAMLSGGERTGAETLPNDEQSN